MLRVQTNEESTVSIPMYPNQLVALAAFKTTYEEIRYVPTHSLVVAAFHSLITSLLKYKFTEQHTQWNNPIAQCIALGQVHFDGSFYNPRDDRLKT